MPELTSTKSPITINEAINILAYNDFFYNPGPKSLKSHINPHPKDKETVRSLAESQYPWTEKQGKLAVIILKRYLTKFQKHGLDIEKLLNKPKYEHPFRKIDWEKSIEKYTNEDNEELIEIKFPYNKKLVALIKCLKDKKGLPVGFCRYDGEKKHWTCKQTDVATYYLTLIATRYDFKFADESLLDDFDEVRNELKGYKIPQANLINNQLVLSYAPASLQEYWDKNLKNKPALQQLDALKTFQLSTMGLNVPAENQIAKKIAQQDSHRLWIDSNEYTPSDVIKGLLELNSFPIMMPISGEVNTVEDISVYWRWLDALELNGIDILKQLSFGFDIKEPVRHEDIKKNDFDRIWEDNNIVEKMDDRNYEKLFELHQMSKQFKYIDKNTKVIFVRNRVPRTLIKSGIQPKASITSIGGGYYQAGNETLKRLLENLPKKLYYTDREPSTLGLFGTSHKSIVRV